MCGLVGIVEDEKHRHADHELRSVIERMNSRLSHRGPDDDGIWIDDRTGVALGHRRLSILDLSARSRQPMFSSSRRYVVVFNGEIYNFQELRQELESHSHAFRTTSDTEVILSAVEQWGVEKAVQRFVGMFAIALWDTRDHRLHLVRDRLGIKPLYYGWIDDHFVFASECGALTAHPDWNGELCDVAVASYMRFGYVPAPFSIYANVFKLPAGCILSLSLADAHLKSDHTPFPPAAAESARLQPKPYWSLKQVFANGLENRFRGSFEDAVRESESLLKEAVRCRLIADVPVGAFLSGGIDSAVVVSLMRECASDSVNTFTIGMDGHTYDEAPRAARLAAILGTNHTEHRVSSNELLAVVPKLGEMYDEPFADSSQIPTYAVCRIARQHVTVALSGDGGDEVFAGYNRYLFTQRIVRRLSVIPGPLRRMIARSLRASRWDTVGKGLNLVEPLLPRALHNRWLGINVPRIADILSATDTIDAYRSLSCICNDPHAFLRRTTISDSLVDRAIQDSGVGSDVQRMMYLDLLGYHSDDILTKVDRASMALGLEVRVPLIDHRVIQFAATLPLEYLISKSRGKLVLRQILKDRSPSYEIDDNKRGFSVPLAQWLRGPLKDWASDLLSRRNLEQKSIFNANVVSDYWRKHLTGKWDYAYQIWSILMFQSFLNAHSVRQCDHQDRPLNLVT